MGRHRTSPGRRLPVQSLAVQRRLEIGPGGYEYVVRPVAGARARKTYRCPGCDHEIRSGTAHVVVWLTDFGEAAVEDRRHWHTPCWTSRATRGPTRKWS